MESENKHAEYTGGTSNTGDQTVFTDEDTEKTIWYILTDADVEGYLSPRLKSRVTGK